jgi:hypothetical protein
VQIANKKFHKNPLEEWIDRDVHPISCAIATKRCKNVPSLSLYPCVATPALLKKDLNSI